MNFGNDLRSRNSDENHSSATEALAMPLVAVGSVVLLVSLGLLFLLPNPAYETTVGETFVYRYPVTHFILIVLMGIGLVMLGWVIKDNDNERIRYLGWAKLCAGIIVIVGLAPCDFVNQTTLSKNELISINRWLWFWPSEQRVDLSSVQSIGETTEVTGQGRRQRTTKYIVFQSAGGGSQKIGASHLVNAALPRIEKLIAERDVAAKAAAVAAAPADPAPTVESPQNAVAQANPDLPAVEGSGTVAPVVDPTAGTAPAQSGSGASGTKIEAQWGDKWWPAEAVEVFPDGRVKVHYVGYGSNFDEIVTPDRVRTVQSAVPASARNEVRPKELPPAATGGLAVGAKIEAFWGNKWWPAEVMEVLADGRIKVHYTGFGSIFDEMVPSDRVRMVTAPAAPAAGVAPADAGTKMRTWTDRTGRRLEAELVEVVGNKVRLRKADGKAVTVPLSKLSAEDLQFLRSSGAMK